MLSDHIALIGTLLTLIGLLGTFFYVHLSTWLRDLISLKTKFDLVDPPGTPEEKQAALECKYTLSGLYNYVPLLTTAALSAFIGFAAFHMFDLLSGHTDIVAIKLRMSLLVFLMIFFGLTGFILVRGYLIADRLYRRIH